VLILGAGGFVGRWVARAATAAGADCTLAARDVRSARAIGEAYEFDGEFVPCDLTDREATRALVIDARPEIVCNLVGYGVDRTERDEGLSHQLNADLPETLVNVCGEIGRRTGRPPMLAHVGSALEYGSTTGAVAEDSPAEPHTVYGSTKLAGTRVLQRLAPTLGVPAFTARLFTVYGPGEHTGRLLPTLVDAAHTAAPIPLSAGLQLRDFTHVEDVATAFLRLARGPRLSGDIVNVASGRMRTVRAFVEEAARVLEIPSDRLQFGAIQTRADEMPHNAVRVDRLRSLLGDALSDDVTDGVQRTMAFLAEAR
jgi:UDP-glucose 4-epimerase